MVRCTGVEFTINLPEVAKHVSGNVSPLQSLQKCDSERQMKWKDLAEVRDQACRSSLHTPSMHLVNSISSVDNSFYSSHSPYSYVRDKA